MHAQEAWPPAVASSTFQILRTAPCGQATLPEAKPVGTTRPGPKGPGQWALDSGRKVFSAVGLRGCSPHSVCKKPMGFHMDVKRKPSSSQCLDPTVLLE